MPKTSRKRSKANRLKWQARGNLSRGQEETKIPENQSATLDPGWEAKVPARRTEPGSLYKRRRAFWIMDGNAGVLPYAVTMLSIGQPV